MGLSLCLALLAHAALVLFIMAAGPPSETHPTFFELSSTLPQRQLLDISTHTRFLAQISSS